MKTFQSFLAEAIKLPLYHGTTSYYLDEILGKKWTGGEGGLKAGGGDYSVEDDKDWLATNKPEPGEKSDRVYLTTDPAIALQEACYSTHGDPFGKTDKHLTHGDPDPERERARPIVLRVDRVQLKGLKSDSEYHEKGNLMKHAVRAFYIERDIPRSAVKEVIRPRGPKGKARLEALYQEFRRATNMTGPDMLQKAFLLIKGY